MKREAMDCQQAERLVQQTAMGCLEEYVSMENARGVVEYVENTRGPLPYLTSDLALQLIEEYEERHDTRIYFPLQQGEVADWIARVKFGYASLRDLRACERDLADLIRAEVKGFRDWRGGNRLWMRPFTDQQPLALAGELVFKSLQHRLTDAHCELVRATYEANYKQWDSDEIREHVRSYLAARADEAFTQVDLANALHAKSSYLYWRLRELVNERRDVISYKTLRHAVAKKREKALVVYKYAPERVLIDKDMGRVDEHVQRLILKVLEKEPHLSQNQLYHRLLARLGQLDNKIVIRNVAALVVAGVVVREHQAFRNTYLHRLADGVAPAEVTPVAVVRTPRRRAVAGADGASTAQASTAVKAAPITPQPRGQSSTQTKKRPAEVDEDGLLVM